MFCLECNPNSRSSARPSKSEGSWAANYRKWPATLKAGKPTAKRPASLARGGQATPKPDKSQAEIRNKISLRFRPRDIEATGQRKSWIKPKESLGLSPILAQGLSAVNVAGGKR
jgi:hypothetical protein